MEQALDPSEGKEEEMVSVLTLCCRNHKQTAAVGWKFDKWSHTLSSRPGIERKSKRTSPHRSPAEVCIYSTKLYSSFPETTESSSREYTDTNFWWLLLVALSNLCTIQQFNWLNVHRFRSATEAVITTKFEILSQRKLSAPTPEELIAYGFERVSFSAMNTRYWAWWYSNIPSTAGIVGLITLLNPRWHLPVQKWKESIIYTMLCAISVNKVWAGKVNVCWHTNLQISTWYFLKLTYIWNMIFCRKLLMSCLKYCHLAKRISIASSPPSNNWTLFTRKCMLLQFWSMALRCLQSWIDFWMWAFFCMPCSEFRSSHMHFFVLIFRDCCTILDYVFEACWLHLEWLI